MNQCVGQSRGRLKEIIGGKASRLVDIREDEGFGLHIAAAQRIKEYLSSRIEPESGKSYWTLVVDAVDMFVDDTRLLEYVKKLLLASGLPASLRDDFDAHYKESGFDSVAVRSSGIGEDGAQRSFAGIGRSLVNISGTDDILAAIVAVSASGSTRRVAEYMAFAGEGSRREIEMPVWIHPTVRSEYSAVVFTRNPTSGRKQIIIQPTRGMLASVVDGRVPADEIVFEKRGGQWTIVGFPVVQDKGFYDFANPDGNSYSRVINSVQARRSFSLPVGVLRAILDRIERFENESPVSLSPSFTAGADFEVAIGPNKHVQIVQVRPITTGKLAQSAQKAKALIETSA